MSKIYLIRHGQASFGAENYDKLSDLGRNQAKVLGEYYHSQGQVFDQIIHGNMSRQIDTATLMANEFSKSTQFECHSGADEFNSDELLSHYLPKLIESSKSFAKLIESEQLWYADKQHFETIFRALIALWQTDDDCPFESWIFFQKRVIDLLSELSLKQESNRKIAIVTSGGFISIVLQYILGFDNETFMDVCLTINNASVTEIQIKSGASNGNQMQTLRGNVVCFNNVTPLKLKKDRKLITRK